MLFFKTTSPLQTPLSNPPPPQQNTQQTKKPHKSTKHIHPNNTKKNTHKKTTTQTQQQTNTNNSTQTEKRLRKEEKRKLLTEDYFDDLQSASCWRLSARRLTCIRCVWPRSGRGRSAAPRLRQNNDGVHVRYNATRLLNR